MVLPVKEFFLKLRNLLDDDIDKRAQMSIMRLSIICCASLVSASLIQLQSNALMQLHSSLNLNLDWAVSSARTCLYSAENVLGVTMSLNVNSNSSSMCCWARVTCCLGLPCSSRIKQEPYGHVKCGCEPGTAVSIDLSGLGLLLAALEPLSTTLSYLDISGNLIHGSIPSAISSFLSLTYVAMAKNQITGGLGSDWSLLPLITIDLSSNKITGTVPRGLCKSGSLETSPLINLDLSNNQISGIFDVPFCISLESLDLSSNHLKGLGSEGGAKWFPGYTSLRSVIVDNYALLHATIPNISSTQLQSLSASSCGLVGTLPTSLFELSLTSLDLGNNSLSGSLPQSVID